LQLEAFEAQGWGKKKGPESKNKGRATRTASYLIPAQQDPLSLR
jgi:hypothetical protein